MTQYEYIKKIKRQKRLILYFRIGLFILFFILWETFARLRVIDDFIFSSPTRMLHTFKEMLPGGIIFYHIGITLMETLLSFILVMLLGIGSAVLLWRFHLLSKIVEPYLIALNSLPKTALAPVLIVWLGNNIKTIIVCAILLAVFSTTIHLHTAFANADSDKLLLIQTLGGTKKDQLTKVILPESFPVLIGSLKVNIGLCLVGVIIGEFLAANAGLGYLIIYSSQVFKLDTVMLSIMILCCLSVLLYSILYILEQKYHY